MKTYWKKTIIEVLKLINLDPPKHKQQEELN